MKTKGLRSGGGFTRRSRPGTAKQKVPDGFSRTPTGRCKVVAKAYMRELHALNTAPLELGLPGEGVLELHHTRNPSGGPRKDNDATVVPLLTTTHQFMEANPLEERAFQRIFSAWSAFRYWCFHAGRSGTNEDALAYHAWVLKKMEEG